MPTDFDIPLSSQELAKEFGITPSTLTRWRKGERSPKGYNSSLWSWIKASFEYDPEKREWIPRA